MAKKINSLEDLGGFVFSTNKDFEFNTDTSEAKILHAMKKANAKSDSQIKFKW